MPINQWPSTERPRERLLGQGAAALSDAELLAIFLRTGVHGCSAVDLGRALLERHGGLAQIFAASPDLLLQTAGIGPAKVAQLQAAFELARRALDVEMRKDDPLRTPNAVRDYLRLTLATRPYEVFAAVYLDSRNRVIAFEELFRGTLTQTSVWPREVVKAALAKNAAALILAHNHPSGVAEPSPSDHALTEALCKALRTVDIGVLDHVVIAGNVAVSFAERGWL